MKKLPAPFFDSQEEYDMERESNGKYKAKYLTIELFEKFVNNEFWHIKQYAKWSVWLSLVVLATLIGTLVVRFFFG